MTMNDDLTKDEAAVEAFQGALIECERCDVACVPHHWNLCSACQDERAKEISHSFKCDPTMAAKAAMRRVSEGWDGQPGTAYLATDYFHADHPYVWIEVDSLNDRIRVRNEISERCVTFRPRKDGTFNVAGIAARIRKACDETA